MATTAAQLLAQGHAMLNFVLYPPTTRDTSGIAVNNTTLMKVKAWAEKQEDPVTGDHVANASQVVRMISLRVRVTSIASFVFKKYVT